MRYRGGMDATTRPLSSADAAAAEELLRDAPFAYLAMVEQGGPYAVPLNFAYVGGRGDLDGRVYFHTGEGRKTEALAADPRVCLAVVVGVAFDQGDSPCADGFSYRSLLVWGPARRIEDRDRRETALRAIVAKYDPAAAEAPFGEADFAGTLVYEVFIEAASYKQQPQGRSG
jgi:uncharacterized protein